MPFALGPETVRGLAFPQGIDTEELARYITMDGGYTPERVVTDLVNALAVENGRWLRDTGFLVNIQTGPVMEYINGVGNLIAPRTTDVSQPHMVTASTAGHSLPLHEHILPIGGTPQYWRKVRREKFNAQVRAVIIGHRQRYLGEVLQRLFRNDIVRIDGGSGYSPGFCSGNTGDNAKVPYTPLGFGGHTFDDTHNHYIANNDWEMLIEAMIAHLSEHEEMSPPFTAIVSQNDLATLGDLGSFRKIISTSTAFIDLGGRTGEAGFYETGSIDASRWFRRVGAWNSGTGEVIIRSSPRVNSGYIAMFRSNMEGNISAENPLAVRVDPRPLGDDAGGGDEMFGMRFALYLTGNQTQDELEEVRVYNEFGVGVGASRVNGVVGKKAATYTNHPSFLPATNTL